MVPRISFEDLVRFDFAKQDSTMNLIAGVDEAGRGALAGPVVAAAVICEPHEKLSRVRDSKLLTEAVREDLAELIKKRSLAWGVGIVGPEEIDRLNILKATLKAMKNAVRALRPSPSFVLVDGRRLPNLDIPAQAVTGGDGKSFIVAAASILAKVARDDIMRRSARDFPGYGFVRNKGYGTKEHIRAIQERGRTAFHRRSFRIRSLGEGSGGCGGENRSRSHRRANRRLVFDT